eukprot:TRINITY_DN39761_c0_g1_i1.p2 TRINITY_DN39761_c0_g1~~TRINITY_DN39761_c0_g1_i1.p2  ORF type:complete len:190 (+),score=-3.95 TRINITY_DN39761_c0_g1_i1:352-921(+)
MLDTFYDAEFFICRKLEYQASALILGERRLYDLQGLKQGRCVGMIMIGRSARYFVIFSQLAFLQLVLVSIYLLQLLCLSCFFLFLFIQFSIFFIVTLLDSRDFIKKWNDFIKFWVVANLFYLIIIIIIVVYNFVFCMISLSVYACVHCVCACYQFVLKNIQSFTELQFILVIHKMLNLPKEFCCLFMCP